MAELPLSAFFLPFAATIALIFAFGGAAGGSQVEVVPALYVFGDSTVDVGNNNFLPGSSAKANYPPYGVDYPGGVPTGRFTNGYNLADLFAKKLGFEESPPPALSTASASQESKGVNYASGSSGVLDTTGRSVSLSMNEQIALFQSTVERLVETRGRRAAGARLGRSFFAFSTANNDMFAFFRSGAGATRNLTRDGNFVSALASAFRDQLKEIYDLGARRFGIFGVGDLGCAPFLKTRSGRCLEGLNGMAASFNEAMQAALEELRSTSEGMVYSYVHSREISSAVVANSSQFGFKDVGRICCGDGAETPCTPAAGYCSDRREYMSWDGLHPTEAAYNVTVAFAYDGSSEFAAPINFRQLAWSSVDGILMAY